MDQNKSALKSVTILSATASAVLSMLGATGVIDMQGATDASQAVGQLLSAGLALIAVYGRVRATSRIGS